METKIFAVKKPKDVKAFKEKVLEKVKLMVSADATLSENLINVKKDTQWTKSKATITFSEKEGKLEILLATSHSATEAAIGAGCVLAFLGLILVIVPWYLYDQDKKQFDDGLVNVINYFVQQE